MTFEEINKLEAGRPLDAMIAEKVFGMKVDYEFESMGIISSKALASEYFEDGVIPFYSTEMGDAWLVVEWFAERYPKAHLRIDRFGKFWSAGLLAKNGVVTCGNTTYSGVDTLSAHALTPSLAICRAALKCMEVQA